MAALTQKSLIVMILAATLVVVVLGYFVYDRLRPPCETIFEQTAARLSVKLDTIKAAGAGVLVGREKVQELSDSSQKLALNLKACCVVLGGKLSSSEFQQCRANVEQQEERFAQLADIFKTAQTAKEHSKPEIVNQKTAEANKVAEQVKTSAADLEKRVSVLTTATEPKSASPRAVSASGSESEPNNDAFQVNAIKLGATVVGEISPAKDADWFAFPADTKLRDWVDIKIENRSTTLQPCVAVHDSNRNQLGGTDCAKNPAANLELARVLEPGKDYHVAITSHYASTSGVYAFSTRARKAYDAYEPNDDVLSARPISAGKTIDANIMYNGDADWYLVKGFAAKQLIVRLENRSTTLKPCVAVSDARRNQIGGTDCARNAAADVELEKAVEPGKDYYVAISSHYASSAGEYRLTILRGKE